MHLNQALTMNDSNTLLTNRLHTIQCHPRYTLPQRLVFQPCLVPVRHLFISVTYPRQTAGRPRDPKRIDRAE